jgi:hypothetical protein
MWKHRTFNLPRSITERKQAQQIHESQKLRRSNWVRMIVATLPSIVFGVFTVVFTLQQNSSSRATREQDQRYSNSQSKRAIFDNYIDIISGRLLDAQFNRSMIMNIYKLYVLKHLLHFDILIESIKKI